MQTYIICSQDTHHFTSYSPPTPLAPRFLLPSLYPTFRSVGSELYSDGFHQVHSQRYGCEAICRITITPQCLQQWRQFLAVNNTSLPLAPLGKAVPHEPFSINNWISTGCASYRPYIGKLSCCEFISDTGVCDALKKTFRDPSLYYPALPVFLLPLLWCSPNTGRVTWYGHPV